MKNIAIIFAGGSGTRMKTNGLPKQFLKVDGKSIIIKTLENFERNNNIDYIYIACKKDWIDYLKEEVSKFGLKKIKKIVSGGETGQDSIYNALNAAYQENPGDSIVLIHDGVRPFITQELINQNIEDVKKYGSSITVTPCFETAIVSEDGSNVGLVPDRANMYTAQAPQCFYLKDIISVHEKVRKQEAKYGNIVDSCNLMRENGINVHMTHGNRNNIKVTTPTDYYVIQALYKYEQDTIKENVILNPIIKEDIDNILSEKINYKKLEGKSVLITGASGMFGSYIMYALAALNDLQSLNITIIALVRNKNKIPNFLMNRRDIIVLEQDVCDKILYKEDVDYIIHAASPASPKIMKDDPVGTIKANTLGTFNTLKYAVDKKAIKYIYISSREIYGNPIENKNIFNEENYGIVDPVNVRSCYPEGKKAAETMCVSFKEQYNLDVKIVRPAHTYGPGMSIYDGRVQADFLKNIVNGENIIMKSEGDSIRTYTYISDVIAGIFYVMLESKDVVYNIADQEAEISIKGLAELLVGLYPEKNIKIEKQIDKNQKGCAPFKTGIICSDKLKQLGWNPKVKLNDGFRRTIEYIEKEKNKEK